MAFALPGVDMRSDSTIEEQLASVIAVALGRLLEEAIDLRWLHYGGAALFLILGVIMLVRGPGGD